MSQSVEAPLLAILRALGLIENVLKPTLATLATEISHVSASPSKAVSRPWSLVGLSVAITVLAALLGLGAYIEVKNLIARNHYREAVRAVDANQLADARRHLDECLAFWKKDAEVHFLAARVCRRLREFEEAERHLDICRQIGFDPEKTALERAMMQAQRENPAQVESYLRARVDEFHPDWALVLEALIQGYLKTCQLSQAYFCANLWMRRETGSSQARFWRGMVYEKVLYNRGAADDFRDVIAAEPDNAEARLHYADLLLGFKEYAVALGQYEWLTVREPNKLQVLLGLAACHVGLNRVEQADELLNQLLNCHPDNPQVLAECGKLGMKLGKAAEAEDWLRRSVGLDPYEPEAVFAFSQVLQQRGKLDEARKWRDEHERIKADLTRLVELNKAILASPLDPGLRHEIGVIFIRNGHEKEGVNWLQTALQIDRRHGPTHRTLAGYYERHGLAREAAYHRLMGDE